MKKITFLSLISLLFIFSFAFFSNGFLINTQPNKTIFADDLTQEEIEEEIENTVGEQLDGIDFSALDKFVQGLADKDQGIFGASSFAGKIQKLISGELTENYGSVFGAIVGILFEEILSFLPLLATIVAIAVLSSIINSIKSERNKSLADLIHFVCYGVIVVIIVKVCIDFLQVTTNLLNAIKTQMEVVLPILLTFMTSMGGVMSAKVYQPLVVILSSVVVTLFTKILLPIFICCFVFAVLTNLTNVARFEKFQAFFMSLFKWICGTVFTVFMSFLALQGITASTHDGIAIRTAKYTIKGSVPIIGGVLSDGFDIILTSSLLIKNAIGVGGIVLLLATVLIPVAQIVVFTLLLKLVSAIIEPIADSRITNLLSSVSKILPLLVVLILGATFMFAITLVLIMFTANRFV